MPQADRTELFVVQPDAPPAPLPDVGVHSWPIGSYAPMAFYRPVPIVHFTGTVLLQFLLSMVLHAWLADAPGILTIVVCAVVAIVLGRRAYVRWLAAASTAWKVATTAALIVNLLFFSFITLARGCGVEKLATGLERAALERSTAEEGCQPSMAELMAGYTELL